MKLRNLVSLMIIFFVHSVIPVALAGENSDSMKSLRKQMIKTGKTGRTITYGTGNQGEIWVFTDLGCPACHKLHQDVAELNNLGIKLHIMAFPRQGIGSNGYTKMVNIWCSKDPENTLTRAMRGESIPESTCENPVNTQYTLGQTWGIAGTPTIIFSDGTQWSGYFSPDRLAKEAVARKDK